MAKRMDSHYRDGIVIEDCRNVFGREFVCRVADEKTSLAHGTITDDDTSAGSALALYSDRFPLYPFNCEVSTRRSTEWPMVVVGGTHFIVATTIVPLSTPSSLDHRAETTQRKPL